MKSKQFLFVVAVVTLVMTAQSLKVKLDNGDEVEYGCLPNKYCGRFLSSKKVGKSIELKYPLYGAKEKGQFKVKG